MKVLIEVFKRRSDLVPNDFSLKGLVIAEAKSVVCFFSFNSVLWGKGSSCFEEDVVVFNPVRLVADVGFGESVSNDEAEIIYRVKTHNMSLLSFSDRQILWNCQVDRNHQFIIFLKAVLQMNFQIFVVSYRSRRRERARALVLHVDFCPCLS